MPAFAGPKPAPRRRPSTGRRREAAAREELVDRFLPLARSLARRYQRAGEPLDDLVQVASIGLLKAIDRFEPERNTAFSTYAVPTIVGELQHHLRDRGWWVRVPRDLQELAGRVMRVAEDLTSRLGRAPTAAEIAAECRATTEEVMEARQAAQAQFAVSFDIPADDGEGEYVRDSLGAEDPGFRRTEAAATVEGLMQVLSERDREVLRLRFEEDLTQSEIGARVGISQMHVSRILRDAIERLRDAAAG
jgi:RNA polymerase sigma-B factor